MALTCCRQKVGLSWPSSCLRTVTHVRQRPSWSRSLQVGSALGSGPFSRIAGRLGFLVAVRWCLSTNQAHSQPGIPRVEAKILPK